MLCVELPHLQWRALWCGIGHVRKANSVERLGKVGRG